MINESLIPTECHFTAYTSLAALGVQLRHLNLFGPIQEAVLFCNTVVEHSGRGHLTTSTYPAWLHGGS
jgi:hypothetical protein